MLLRTPEAQEERGRLVSTSTSVAQSIPFSSTLPSLLGGMPSRNAARVQYKHFLSTDRYHDVERLDVLKHFNIKA
jgi:hypothetical protein